jgi:hypothetical protein
VTDMPAWTNVISLAKRNWKIDLRLTQNGVMDPMRRAFGIWAKAHYWQGRVADVCLHAHRIIPADPKLEGEALSGMRHAISRLMEVCARAEAQYTEGFPCQTGRSLPDGSIELAPDSWADRHWTSGRMDFFPECTIPDEPSRFASPDKDRLLATVLGLSRDHHVEVGLDPWAGSPAIHQMKRTWQVTARLSRFAHEGERLSFNPVRFRSEMLFEDVAADLLQVAATGIDRALRNAAPEMPPGFRTLAQYRREEEARKAAMTVDEDQGEPFL